MILPDQFRYIQQKDLVVQLAKSRERCDNLEKALQHQRHKNNKFRAQLALYQEKEAVQVATDFSLGTALPFSVKESQALVLQLAQSLAVALPNVSETSVTRKPVAPMKPSSTGLTSRVVIQ